MSDVESTDTGETRRAIGGELWHGAAAALDALADALAHPDGPVTVKENRRRSVKRYPLPQGGHIYVKRFRDSGLGQTLKAMTLGSRAWREIKWARELIAGGVAAAEPMAWAESTGGKVATGAVAHRGVAGGVPVIDVVHDPATDPARRQRILRDVASQLRRAHDLGIGFRDFHLGNVLITPGDTLVFIDLQSAWRPGPLLGRIRLANLAMALTSIPRSAWPHARRALADYGPIPGLTAREVARGAAERATKMIRRHFRSRSERCLRDSTEFVVEHRGGWRVFRRRDHDGEAIARIPSQGLKEIEAGTAAVVKDARESAVIRGLPLNDRAIVAKRFLPKSLAGVRQWLGHGRGRRAWVAGNTCKALGVPVALPIALLEGGGGESWMIMADLHDHTPLDRVLHLKLQEAAGRDLRALAIALGVVLGAAHAAAVLHADWKACNIMIGPDDAVAFVDYDRVEFPGLWGSGSVDDAKAARALAQLNTSVPRAITRSARLRVLATYLQTRFDGTDRETVKRWFRMVWDASRDRKILSVGPAGDVHESWDGAAPVAAPPA